jgi:hypothetical protein
MLADEMRCRERFAALFGCKEFKVVSARHIHADRLGQALSYKAKSQPGIVARGFFYEREMMQELLRFTGVECLARWHKRLPRKRSP